MKCVKSKYVVRSNKGRQTNMEPYLPGGELFMLEDEDAVVKSPGFPMSTPQLCPHQAGD